MTQSDDEEPTEQELADAAALARALDGHGTASAPEDALSTASFLRYANRGKVLDPERSQAILEDAIRGARKSQRRSRRFGLFAAFGLSVAAASLLLFTRSVPKGPAPLPTPPSELLSAELEAARGGTEDLAALENEMRPYRGRIYAALEERYRK